MLTIMLGGVLLLQTLRGREHGIGQFGCVEGCVVAPPPAGGVTIAGGRADSTGGWAAVFNGCGG
jgi:hypothetical protein